MYRVVFRKKTEHESYIRNGVERLLTHKGCLRLLNNALFSGILFGIVAQLGEHRFCKAGVAGSNPVGSICTISAF